MDLIYRATEPQDFEACLHILQDRFAYRAEVEARLPEIWGQLLSSGCLNSAVLEDRERPPGQRLVQFGMSVFVTDECMQQARNRAALHLAPGILDLMLQGCSPILDAAAIRCANSQEGLNLLVLHFGCLRHPWSAEEFPRIMAKMPESFFWLHQGYQLREILMEFYDESIVRFCRESGFRLRANAVDDYQAGGLPLPAPGQRPYLLGITRDEAYAEIGTHVGKLFAYSPPRFCFRTGAQQLLLRALLGETDEEIAAGLDVALSTVKKRWSAIYDQIADQAPGLLPHWQSDMGLTEQKRGAEKRRHLLGYLRQHPEELRPYAR